MTGSTVGLLNNNTANAAFRTLDQPSGTLYFGARLNVVRWVDRG